MAGVGRLRRRHDKRVGVEAGALVLAVEPVVVAITIPPSGVPFSFSFPFPFPGSGLGKPGQVPLRLRGPGSGPGPCGDSLKLGR